MSIQLVPVSEPRFVLIETDVEQLGNSASLVPGVGGTVVVAVPGLFGSFTYGTEKTMTFPYVDSGDIDVEFRRFNHMQNSR